MINAKGLYEFEDISFVNTQEFTRTAQHYLKYGCYTFADPDSYEYDEFWDIEEDRIHNGMTLPGKLICENGIYRIQNVTITGEHYAYLNYGRIKRTTKEGKEIEEVIKLSSQERNGKLKGGRKKISFPDFWDGDYHYYKAKQYAQYIGKHMAIAKARRKGFSYKEGFDAALTSNFNSDFITIVGAYDHKYVRGEGQIMDMAMRYLDFFNERTDFGRGYLNRNAEIIKLGYIEEGDLQRIEKGYLSSIISLSFKDNPKAAIGKDAAKIVLEECGDFPNLETSLIETLPTMRDGNLTTGFLSAFGATTDDVGNFEPFKQVYYNPNKFNMLAFEDIWEGGEREKGVCYFFPNVQNLVPFIDEHGNSLKEESEKSDAEERENARQNLDANEFQIYKSKYCNKPSEAFFTSGGSVLASPELLLYIQELETNRELRNQYRAGYLTKEGKKIKFNFEHPITGEEPKPIFNFPLRKDDDPTGCIVEWEVPFTDKNGEIPDNLYYIVVDPYATNKEKGQISLRNSLGAAYVYKRVNNLTSDMGDTLVASYVGREGDTEDYSRQLFYLAERWNAKIQYESNRGTIFQDAKLLGYVDRLCLSPEFNFSKDISGKLNGETGVYMNTQRIPKAIGYLNSWLHTKRGGKRENGSDFLNLHTIKDLALLKEIVNWNKEQNFDRVSALLILMFQIKEMEYDDVITESSPDILGDTYFNNFQMFS